VAAYIRSLLVCVCVCVCVCVALFGSRLPDYFKNCKFCKYELLRSLMMV